VLGSARPLRSVEYDVRFVIDRQLVGRAGDSHSAGQESGGRQLRSVMCQGDRLWHCAATSQGGKASPSEIPRTHSPPG